MVPVMHGFADELTKLATDGKLKVEVDVDKAYRAAARQPRHDYEMKDAIKRIRGEGRRVSRDYLASMLIGAASVPVAGVAGKLISRGIHNRQLIKEIARAGTKSQKNKLVSEIQAGPIIGSLAKTYKGGLPAVSTSELAGMGAQGALTGSIIQMLRDRFSGSAGT